MKDSILPIILFIILFVVIMLITQKARSERHYDEMQLQIRKNGYKLSFIVVMVLTMITGIAYEFAGDVIAALVSPGMIMISIALIGVIVLSIYSIAKDSFFAINEKGIPYMILCGAIAGINIIALISTINDGEFFKDNILTFKEGGANIVMTVFFLVIFVAIAVKKISNRKVEAE